MTADLMLIWPELILTIGGLITLMLGTFMGDRQVGIYQLSALLTLAAAAAAVVALFGVEASVFSGTLSVDSFGGFAKLLIYAASFVSILIAPRFFAGGMRAEYPALILFATLGMGIMASSRDLMTLYVGLELNSLAAYVLASFMRNDDRSSEAGLKYFILGALASGMLLYGISLLYGFSGTTDFTGIAKAMGGELNIGLIFGIVFVLAGLGFKISAVPFHMWTPDVYEGAPTPVTTFFASAPKVAAMAMMTRVVGCWRAVASSRPPGRGPRTRPGTARCTHEHWLEEHDEHSPPASCPRCPRRDGAARRLHRGGAGTRGRIAADAQDQ